eukprot:NODE_5140_length_693_cov_30.438163_g4977_i0.p2 GENE.NODE_5140_length_693_cov_30.438163_g4977_i0~~NODE_5140_length_693_cov_30.438163_g4977_i0.p2  ORF type:complete len:127 (+),score=5.64 NODE_5140_length_693_cov_30.438163_g4977_i0:277-657(+)
MIFQGFADWTSKVLRFGLPRSCDVDFRGFRLEGAWPVSLRNSMGSSLAVALDADFGFVDVDWNEFNLRFDLLHNQLLDDFRRLHNSKDWRFGRGEEGSGRCGAFPFFFCFFFVTGLRSTRSFSEKK